MSRIKSRCLCRRYGPGEPIVGHLDTSDEVYFLLTGDARVTIRALDGKAVMFRELAAGGMFGEYAAIDGRPRSATVEARTDCLVASIPAVAFRELLETEPKSRKKVARALCLGDPGADHAGFEFSTLAVRYRIQAEVLRLGRSVPTPQGKTASIDPAPTHAEIASRTSTHREAVTRELNRLTKMGILEQRSRVLWIKDLARLEALVRDAGGE